MISISNSCVYFQSWLSAVWSASDQPQLWGQDMFPGPAATGLHSYLQKSLSPLGRWSPSMAKRCTTLLWITRRHRVCKDGTVERRLSKAN